VNLQLDCEALLSGYDANLDTPSYTEYREGYWLTREAMKWFWDSYVSAQTSRKESKLSPFLVAHGGSWTGFSDVKEVYQANNNIRSVPIPEHQAL
jgi:hypothetical protein